MVTGGAEGRLIEIDMFAFGLITFTTGHKNVEVIDIYIYDEQKQVISVSEDRTICLYDVNKLVML